MSTLLDLTGERFGSLVVKTRGPNQDGRVAWVCTCDCGGVKTTTTHSLRNKTTRSCGCKHWGKERYEHIYQRLVASADKRDVPLHLSFSEFLGFIGKDCHYCGAKLTWLERCAHIHVKGADAYNIDRKNSALGYSVDNCVACCYVCNSTKNNKFTYDEFLLIAHGLRLVQYLRNPVPKEQMNFMHTFSGKMFRYLHPDPEDVCIEDIAHSLSQLNRFVGQTTKPYSVAQHSVLVSQVCPRKFMLYGLLHDASEAYTNDVCRVLKLSPGMGIYKWYENLAMSAVCKKFHLPEKEPPEVKTADLVLLLTEKRDLFKNTCLWAVNKYDGTSHLDPLKKKIRPWTAEEAEEKFLDRFQLLK